jgi:hypothetical protein
MVSLDRTRNDALPVHYFSYMDPDEVAALEERLAQKDQALQKAASTSHLSAFLDVNRATLAARARITSLNFLSPIAANY